MGGICVWLEGVVVRRYIDFLLLIPTPLASVIVGSSIIPTYCSLIKHFLFSFILNTAN